MPDWRTHLMEEYPSLFSVGPGGARAGYPDVEDGWRDLLERALRRISAAVGGTSGTVRITQIKEKFAGIGIYYDATGLSPETISAIDGAIDLAEARSECTCEVCGEEGTLCDDAGWYTTRCTSHAVGSVRAGDRGRQLRTVYSGPKAARQIVRRYDRAGDRFIVISDTGDGEGATPGGGDDRR